MAAQESCKKLKKPMQIIEFLFISVTHRLNRPIKLTLYKGFQLINQVLRNFNTIFFDIASRVVPTNARQTHTRFAGKGCQHCFESFAITFETCG